MRFDSPFLSRIAWKIEEDDFSAFEIEVLIAGHSSFPISSARCARLEQQPMTPAMDRERPPGWHRSVR
jgi:hypothetical protein